MKCSANTPDINAVMVASETMAQSVVNVLKSQNLVGRIAVSRREPPPRSQARPAAPSSRWSGSRR